MEKFINATHLIQTLEDTKPLIDSSHVSAFQKTVCKMTLDGAIQYMQKEMAAGGEFRQVVHAHWIDDYGNSACSECGCECIEVDENYWRNDRKVMFCPYCGAIMDEEVK